MEDIFRIVTKAFGNKVDKGGSPYVYHLNRVADKVMVYYSEDYELKEAAFCYDLLEDIKGWTPEKLGEYVSPRVVNLVSILTHKEYEPYKDYIDRVAMDKDAIKIKLADLEDNMDITRLPELTEKDIVRLKKYHKYYIYLKNL